MKHLVFGLGALTLLLACGDSGSSPGGGGAGAGSDGGAPTSGGGPGSGAGGDGGAPSSGGGPSSGGAPSSGGGPGSGGAGGAPNVCLQDLSAGHHEVTCAGNILYDVEIPSACTSQACGLIVDMHGYTMNGDSQDENTGMRALGQQQGYIVVQPTAPTDGFGQPSWDQPTHAPLVAAFLSELVSALPIDPKRVHAMGFSQGGGMTFRLLCDHADLIASAAPIGALAGCDFAGPNVPSEEVDILHVHGRQDPIVSFGAVAVPQRDAALSSLPFGAPNIFEEDGNHRATRWQTPSGTVFEFWEHDYTTSASVVFVDLDGHCVPGGDDLGGTPAGYSCEDLNTFVFGELAVAFFQAHPKP